jgi:chromosome segregation ATPase
VKKSSSRWWDRFTPATKADIEKILMKQADLQASLDALTAQLDKATEEITTEIKTLTDALANVDLPQGAVDSLDRLKAKVQALDDLNPDAPAPTPAPPPTT